MSADIDAFLRAHGFGDHTRISIAGDAGGRHYTRLARDGRSAILLDARRDGPIDAYLSIGGWLAGIGLHSPRIIATDPAERLALIEDMGDGVVSRHAWSMDEEREIYRTATDVILRMQEAAAPPGLPRMDEEMLLQIVELFLGIELPDLPPAARRDFQAIWRDILPLAHLGEPAFLHRDYHSPNLVWMPERSSLDRLGVLDFQDAFIGPRAYDLVSLIDDPRRDVGPDAAMAARLRYLEFRPDLASDMLDQALAVLGAQRALRIRAVFRRLERAGKPTYAALLPRVNRYLGRRLAHPVMRELRAWLADQGVTV